MLVEEIARLTGTLKFNVEARPLIAFEKRLNGVMNLLREFSTIANKKFTVKVALDSKSLRAQIDRATNSKIVLNNIDVSREALTLQGKRIQDYLNKTTIRLDNVRIDIGKLVEQKRFIRTMMGQLQLGLPIKLKLTEMEAELKRETKAIAARNPIKLDVVINQNQLVTNLRRAIIQAQKNLSAIKLRVENPQVRLKIDKQHLIDEIRAAISGQDFRIRVGAGAGDRSHPGGAGPSLTRGAGQGLSTAAGFARGAIPGLGAAFAFSHMNTINQQMQGQANAMTAVMGSEAAGKEQSAWVKNLSNTIGLDYRQVAPSYNKMLSSGKTSGMSTENVQGIFQGVSEYGRVMGLDSEAMKGSMRAIEQMMNKGQVMSEELKGQLAERMPGAISAMAEAAGYGTDDKAVAKLFKAMEDGDVKSNAVLGKFAEILAERSRVGGALEKAMKSTAAEQARMNTAFTDAVIAFSEGGFDRGMAGFFKTLADSMRRAEPLIRALGGAFEILIQPLNAVFTLIGDLGEIWPDLAKGLGMSEKALAALAVTVGVLMLPFGPFVVALGLAALALEDLVTYAKGGDSVFGRMVKDTEGAQESVDKIKESFNGITKELGLLMEKLGPVSEAFKGITLNDLFLSSLRTVEETLTRILQAMQLIKAIAKGDWSGAGNKANGIGAEAATQGASPLGILSMFNLMTQQKLTQLQTLGQPYMPKPSEVYTGTVDRGQGQTPAPTFNFGGFNIQVDNSAGASSIDIAKSLEEPMKRIAEEAFRGALGAARAQQAER